MVTESLSNLLNYLSPVRVRKRSRPDIDRMLWCVKLLAIPREKVLQQLCRTWRRLFVHLRRVSQKLDFSWAQITQAFVLLFVPNDLFFFADCLQWAQNPFMLHESNQHQTKGVWVQPLFPIRELLFVPQFEDQSEVWKAAVKLSIGPDQVWVLDLQHFVHTYIDLYVCFDVFELKQSSWR